MFTHCHPDGMLAYRCVCVFVSVCSFQRGVAVTRASSECGPGMARRRPPGSRDMPDTRRSPSAPTDRAAPRSTSRRGLGRRVLSPEPVVSGWRSKVNFYFPPPVCLRVVLRLNGCCLRASCPVKFNNRGVEIQTRCNDPG